MGVEKALEIGKFFAWKDKVFGVGTVGEGVRGRAEFAVWGFGARGFQRVEARGEFSFIVVMHCGDRIADEGEGVMGKWFRIKDYSGCEWVGVNRDGASFLV